MKRLLVFAPLWLGPVFALRVCANLGAEPPPALTIHDVVVAEDNQHARPVLFTVELSAPSQQVVTVRYAAVDGTARPGSDFIPTNGILTFAAGETSALITVVLIPDPIREPDQDFFVQLSDAVGATLADRTARGVIVELRVTQITRSGGGIQLRFPTGTGASYRVERRAELGQGQWVPVAGAENVPGTGTPVTVVDAGALSLPRNFYRVIQLP